jgi:hypothetical protein
MAANILACNVYLRRTVNKTWQRNFRCHAWYDFTDLET